MTVQVRIPTQLRPFTQGLSEVEADGTNVGEVIDAIAKTHPAISERLFDESGALRRFINVYLQDEDIRFLDGLGTEVSPGDRIAIIPAVAGGAL